MPLVQYLCDVYSIQCVIIYYNGNTKVNHIKVKLNKLKFII